MWEGVQVRGGEEADEGKESMVHSIHSTPVPVWSKDAIIGRDRSFSDLMDRGIRHRLLIPSSPFHHGAFSCDLEKCERGDEREGGKSRCSFSDGKQRHIPLGGGHSSITSTSWGIGYIHRRICPLSVLSGISKANYNNNNNVQGLGQGKVGKEWVDPNVCVWCVCAVVNNLNYNAQ